MRDVGVRSRPWTRCAGAAQELVEAGVGGRARGEGHGVEAAAGVGEVAIRKVPDRRAGCRDAPAVGSGGPAVDGRGPPGPRRGVGSGEPAILGAEVEEATNVVDVHSGPDGVVAVGEGEVERVGGHRRPGAVRDQQHRRREERGVVDVGDELAEIELPTLAVGDGDQAERSAVHATGAADVGVGAEHRQDACHVDPHAGQAGDRVGGVELPGSEAHPRLIGSHPDLAAEPCGERVVPWSADHPHPAQVAAGGLGQLLDVGIGHEVRRGDGCRGSALPSRQPLRRPGRSRRNRRKTILAGPGRRREEHVLEIRVVAHDADDLVARGRTCVPTASRYWMNATNPHLDRTAWEATNACRH